MSKAYRSADEQELLSLRALERRIANLERASAGQSSMDAVASIDVTITATATPGTAITGATLTISRPGRYGVVGIFDFLSGLSGWLFGAGILLKNGVEVSPTKRAFIGDPGTGSVRGTQPLFQWQNFDAGDIVSIAAFKGASGGTLQVAAGNSSIDLWRVGPA